MNIKIFFDESGKKNNPPMLMGAISIPEKIYTLNSVNIINSELKSGTIKFHFTKYNGNRGEKDSMLRLFNIFVPYLHMMRFNLLHYVKNEIAKDDFDKMVYSKFPERVFYGLLRGKGVAMNIEADIYMEKATEYEGFPEKFKEQLNIQATYRSESYKINNCLPVPKNTEIGVEFTDIMLGIIRIIIQNKNPTDLSGTYKEKVNLVNKLLNMKEIYDFLKNIKFFEWDNNRTLKEIEFKDYLDSYIVNNIF